MKEIRRATRKRHSAEEKIAIVLAGLRGDVSIAELCRREGIAQSRYYSWSKEVLVGGYFDQLDTAAIAAWGSSQPGSGKPGAVKEHASWARAPSESSAIFKRRANDPTRLQGWRGSRQTRGREACTLGVSAPNARQHILQRL